MALVFTSCKNKYVKSEHEKAKEEGHAKKHSCPPSSERHQQLVFKPFKTNY